LLSINKLENYPAINGNFFQSREFYNVLKTIGWKTFIIQFKKNESKGDVVAFAPKTIPIFDDLFSRFMIYYGPATGKNLDLNILDDLLKEICNEAYRRNAINLHIRTPFPFPYGYEIFRKNGFIRKYEGGEYSCIIDIHNDQQELWSKMSRNARRNVKKAQKKGLKIKSVEVESELYDFYKAYAHTSNRRGFNPHPYSFFKILWEKLEPKGEVKFFVVVWEEKVIAGIINIISSQEVVPYILGSYQKFWNLSPNHLLIWHSMCWAKDIPGASIYKLYHLPPKKDPTQEIDYYTFKSSFGGRLINECTFYNKIISPMKYYISKKIEKIGRSSIINPLTGRIRDHSVNL
jgi:lipid II:glycine glycyltransferase (peptidoglycan interpeptide bridge formation enzyme)